MYGKRRKFSVDDETVLPICIMQRAAVPDSWFSFSAKIHSCILMMPTNITAWLFMPRLQRFFTLIVFIDGLHPSLVYCGLPGL